MVQRVRFGGIQPHAGQHRSQLALDGDELLAGPSHRRDQASHGLDVDGDRIVRAAGDSAHRRAGLGVVVVVADVVDGLLAGVRAAALGVE